MLPPCSHVFNHPAPAGVATGDRMSIFGTSIKDAVGNEACATDARTTVLQKANCARRHRLSDRIAVTLSLVTLLVLTAPAAAFKSEDCYSPDSCQKAQVEDYMRERFVSGQASLSAGITIKTVAWACSDILMYGSPEQNPELGTVRFTPFARQFLDKCAATKGLTPKQ